MRVRLARFVAVSVAASAIVGGASMAAARTGSSSRPPVEITQEVRAQLQASEREFRESAVLPTPSLPPDQAALWREAWTKMADCAHARGVDSFPQAPATFGDGRTPPPILSGSAMGISAEDFGQLMLRCPFDSSKFDRAAFEQSAREVAEHMAGG